MTSSTRSPRANFEAFYAEWYPYAVGVARKRKLADPEAVAADIMLVFFEKDYIDRYDPTMEGAVSFESWVKSMIYKRMANAYRDASRRPQTVELMEDHDAPVEVVLPEETRQNWKAVYTLLEERYGAELAELWVAAVKQVIEDTTARTGALRQWLTAKHLGLPAQKVSARLAELREVISSDPDLRELLGVDRAFTAA